MWAEMPYQIHYKDILDELFVLYASPTLGIILRKFANTAQGMVFKKLLMKIL
jgi:hypothetical protein